MLLTLFITFLKIGAFTFGGGYAMIPLIEQEIEHYHWISVDDFVNFIAVSESTPGPFAVNISTFVGVRTGGIVGALCATLGVVIPSFIIILVVAQFFTKFKDSKAVKGVMTGLKPAVAGLIGASVISVGKTVFIENTNILNNISDLQFYVSAVIFALALYLALKKKHPILIIIISAILGICTGYMLGL